MATATGRRLKHWGWGFEDQQPPPRGGGAGGARGAREHLGFGPAGRGAPRAARRAWSCRRRGSSRPPRWRAICRQDPYERAAHSYGKSYRDVVRAFRGRFDHPPDVVAHPRDEAELEAVLAWCADVGRGGDPVRRRHERGGRRGAGAAGRLRRRRDDRPEGDGPRARGGHGLVAPRASRPAPPARASRTSCASTGSRSATSRSRSSTRRSAAGSPRGRAGTSPRSPPTSTTSWSRCGRSRRAGEWESRRLPGLGRRAEPGPAADRLGGRARRDHRGLGAGAAAAALQASAGVLFPTLRGGRARPCARSPSPASTPRTAACSIPARPRSPAPRRTAGRCWCSASSRPTTRSTPGSRAGSSCARDHGGEAHGEPSTGERGESEGAWRDAFLQAPYLRDTLVAAGILAETFETAITWDRFEAFVAEVRERVGRRAGRRRAHLPPHARLPRRRRALLHGPGPGAARDRSSSSGRS